MRRAGQATQHTFTLTVCQSRSRVPPGGRETFAEGRRKITENESAELFVTLNKQQADDNYIILNHKHTI